MNVIYFGLAAIALYITVAVQTSEIARSSAGGPTLKSPTGILALLATGATIAFAPEQAQTYGSFAAAIGFPMAVVLPMVAILSVTSEWSQRSGLTTFTLVPSRGRVIAAFP